MTADERDLLEDARESLAAARLLLTGGHPRYAASRAYYAMFYVAEAFLEREGLAFSKHSEVIGAFGRYFTRPGVLPVEMHRFLIDAFKTRSKADYGPRGAVTAEKATEVIEQAERFVKVAEEHFGPLPPPNQEQSQP